jgi:Spy/CpxP family protein refolding chaperone
MKKKHLFSVIALVMITGMILVTGCRSNGHKGKHDFAFDYISETLDLTEAQAAGLEEIHREVQAKMESFHKEKQAMKKVLKEQIAADEMDETVIRSLVAQHREKMDQVVDLVVARLLVFHKELTPDQKAKLVKKIEKFEKWHGSRS